MKRHTENEPYESPNKKRRIDSYEQVHMISSSEPASQVWTLGDDLPTTKTLSAFSDAEIYAAALWSLKAGKKDIAFAILNVASERGIAQAQFLLGVYYLDTKDFKKAFDLLLRAAASDNTQALHQLGIMYLKGVGVEKNVKEGIRLFKIVLEKGDTSTIPPLGSVLNLDEEGVEQEDKEEAIRLLCVEAERGNMEAQVILGWAYLAGSLGVSDKLEAKKWLKLAAKQQHMMSAFQLSVMHDIGDGVPECKAKAAKYAKIAADLGNQSAQFNLGVMYDRGEGVEESKLAAAKYYEMASNQGLLKARFNLANMYYQGIGVEEDTKKGIELFRSAAEGGHDISQFNLGLILYDENPTEAAKYWKMAAANNYTGAQLNLGIMLFSGIGVEENKEEAVRSFRLAAKSGSERAQYNLASTLLRGEGTEQNYIKALKYFWRAKAKGLDCKEDLRELFHVTIDKGSYVT